MVAPAAEAKAKPAPGNLFSPAAAAKGTTPIFGSQSSGDWKPPSKLFNFDENWKTKQDRAGFRPGRSPGHTAAF